LTLRNITSRLSVTVGPGCAWFALLAVANLLCAGCDSRSSATPADTKSDFASIDVSSNWLQLVPEQRPAFDPSIHDYVIDCSSGTVDLTATGAADLGFVYLGTTMQPTFNRATSAAAFRQTVPLTPGQAMRFNLPSLGNYSVRCLPPDFPPLSVSISGTPQAEWYVFTPDLTGSGAGDYAIITDAHGTPVWWRQELGAAPIDAKVLDSNHITWARFNFGGVYLVRDFNGQLVNRLTGELDIHDLQPTDKGTYLSIRYLTRVCPPDCADLSPWGGDAQMGVTDGEIVEIDADSNVLWSWNTRDHIALSETGGAGWLPGVGADIIHMNAVEPDGDDAVLFSARHLDAIYRVIKSTGAIDWKIGGTPRAESLTVVGDLRPTAIGTNGQPLNGQHDVRRWPDGTVSVHDNGTNAGRPPSVIRYQLDTTNRTATVVQELHDDRMTTSGCCGSARLLPGGNWLVAWGGGTYMTELDPQGTPLFTINYNSDPTFSYRAVPVMPGVVSAVTLRVGMDAMYRNPPTE